MRFILMGVIELSLSRRSPNPSPRKNKGSFCRGLRARTRGVIVDHKLTCKKLTCLRGGDRLMGIESSLNLRFRPFSAVTPKRGFVYGIKTRYLSGNISATPLTEVPIGRFSRFYASQCPFPPLMDYQGVTSYD